MGWDIFLVSVFGVSFIVTSIVLAIRFPNPTPFQFLVFRTTLALSAGGVAAAIPGFLNLSIDFTGILIRASGALAVFVLVYKINPSQNMIDTSSGWHNMPYDISVGLGSHSGVLQYEGGKEEDIKPIHEDGMQFLSISPITVDRTEDYEQRESQQTDGLLEITRIDIRQDECLWFKMSRPSKNNDLHVPENSEDARLDYLYNLAQYIFHQGKRQKKDKRMKYPVLDIIAVNNSNDTAIIKSVSIAALAAWSEIKAVPIPNIIRPTNAYTIPVDFSKRFSTLVFNDPLCIESKGIWRFSVRLKSFSKSLGSFGNESLITIRLEENNSFCESQPIYMGIYD